MEGRKVNTKIGVKVKDPVSIFLSLPGSTDKRLSPGSPRTFDIFFLVNTRKDVDGSGLLLKSLEVFTSDDVSL